MLIKKGIQTWSGYSGGEGYVDEYELEAKGETLEELEQDVIRMTEENTSEGSRIDFGYVTNVKTVTWEDKIYEVNEFIPPNTQMELDI